MSALIVRTEEVVENHISPYAELSFAEYGATPMADLAHLRWKFLENPQGASIGIHLYSESRLVGRLVAQPRHFIFPDGAQGTAAYMVDLLIHPDFRGIAALAKLMAGMRSLRERFDFVVVTPNAIGAEVWRDLVRMQEQFELTVFVAVLRPGNLARPPTWATPAARAVDRLWPLLLRALTSAFRSDVTFDDTWPEPEELGAMSRLPTRTVRGRRDPVFLRWRFKDSPVFKYRVHFLRKRGRLVGYVVTRKTEYRGYRSLFIVDALGTIDCTAKDWSAIRWKLLGMESLSGGADIIVGLGNPRCGAFSHLARFPFVRVPERLMPERAPLFGERWRKGDITIDGLNMEFTLADCDVI